MQVGFRMNDSEDDWKKSKESLKMRQCEDPHLPKKKLNKIKAFQT